LPDLDRLLERLRARGTFGLPDSGDDDEQGADFDEPDVETLIKAGANVTRVTVREPK